MAVQAQELEPAAAPLPYRGWASRQLRALQRFARTQPMGAFSAVIIVAVGFAAIFAPYLNTTDPRAFGVDILVAPGADHWFGTNRQGQDLWSRVLYGARPSLLIGIGTVALSVVGGTLFALLAGYIGGWVDHIISRLVDMMISLPLILWAMVVTTAFERSVQTIVFAISVGLTPVVIRILRGNVIQEKHRQYVEAARVVGASEARIMVRHILPNVVPLIIVVASATLPAAILAEAGLTFLGVGLPVGEPSWGQDLGPEARKHFTNYWWLPIFPGLALSLTVLAFNLLGDALRDTLDPRLRNVR